MKYECSVPKGDCSGGEKQVEPRARLARVHDSPEEVKACIRAYLLQQGYTAGRNREFTPPDGGPVLVISKRPGMALRRGKEGTRWMAQKLNSPIKAW